MILSDNETKVDLLNNEAIAKTVVSLIKDSKDQPISVGIHGDWGAGKSSILEMVENEVKRTPSEDEKRYSCIRFNGWRHQGFEDSKSVAKTTGKTALGIATGTAPITLLSSAMDALKSTITTEEGITGAIESIGGYLKDAKITEDTSSNKEFSEFQENFSKLLEDAAIKKFERCKNYRGYIK